MPIRVLFNAAAMVVVTAYSLAAQWNPNAGVITPHTATAKMVITSSSGSGSVGNIIDQDDQTHWQSGASLPVNYISRSDQNVFLGKAQWCAGTGTDLNYSLITDGDVTTTLLVPAINSKSVMAIHLPAPLVMPVCVNVKMSMAAGVTVQVYAYSSPTDSVLLGTYTSAQNYSTPRLNFPSGMVVKAVKLHGNGHFTLYEIACMAQPPKEFVVIDLGSVKEIGYIETRHWAGGNATATVLFTSEDGVNWVVLDTLSPFTLPKIPLILPELVFARYIKLEHTLNTVDFAKCLVWEITAYDKYGWMGKRPLAKKSARTLGEMMGVNSLWGWGHNSYSSPTDNGNGPWRFRKILRQARMYHNLNWDVTDPDGTPDFDAMAAGGGTPAHHWLNWDTEYSAWNYAGLNVETSIQFTALDFPTNTWDNPEHAAYNYGFAFADHFGAPSGNHFVKTLEIGNEPWDYPADFYRSILRGMAAGAKTADPTLEVFPCALQAAFPKAETAYFKNFTGARLTAEEAPYLDGLNSHLYCFRNDEQGIRRNINPEAPFSEFWTILADIRFRDANMPGKKIYVTEFGWDSPGGGDNCNHDECVSEKAQAIYGIRAAMLLTRLGIDRFHWYFYGDQYAGTLFSRSGMHSLNFTPKRSFHAFHAMNNLLGDLYFLGVEREDDDAYIYKFGDADSTVTHFVAWKPIDGDANDHEMVHFASPAAPIFAATIEGLDTLGEKQALPGYTNGMISVSIGAVPTIIAINQGSALPVELLKFKGEHRSGDNYLSWEISLSSNWETVTLERSANGIHFNPVHTRGYERRGHFQYTDQQAPRGLLYYRLRFVDAAGHVDLSPLVALRDENAGGYFYPNPVKGHLYLRDMPEDTPFQLVSHIGHIVRQGNFAPTVIDCTGLPKGVYYLVVGDWRNPVLVE